VDSRKRVSMSGVNKAIILGRIGQEPKRSGPALKFSVATSEKWKDKSGEAQERTEWHNVVVFGKLADLCEQYLKKGSQAFIEGRIQTDKYEKDGVTKYSTSIIANTVQFIGKVSQADSTTDSDFGNADNPPF
jgi:single-strand DNA-binding protein